MVNSQTDQIYDNGVLLGALLRITGLNIFEVQAIIRGDLILSNKHDNIRSLVLEDAEWRSTFSKRIQDNKINIFDIKNALEIEFPENDFYLHIYNPNFILNQINFTLKENSIRRKKLVNLIKNKYDLKNLVIANILDISSTTVTKDLNQPL